MVIEQLSISALDGREQELGIALLSLIGPIKVEQGCLSCHLLRTWPMQDRFQVEARWNSETDLVCHLQSDTYKRLLLLMELSATPPVVEFLTVFEFRGLDLVEEARHLSS